MPFANRFHEASPCCKPTSLGTGAGRRCTPEGSASRSPTKTGNLLTSCSAVPLHHVGFVLLDECVGVLLVLQRWMSKHPHGLVQSLQLQRNHDQSLTLQKSSELVAAVGFVWQESMRSEVEHSWIYLCHLLVFLLCHHHSCLHSSSDHWPNSLHEIHSTHLLHSIHLHILLHSPCESGLFSFFLGLFLSLI